MASMIRINNPSLQASRLHLAIQGIILASALTVSSTPHAQTNNDHASVKRSYHIDSGSLSQALRQFATNSGLLFSAEAKLTDGKTTAGLNGEYTVEEGFKKLLAGTGLTYTFTAEDSVSIKAVDAGSDTSTLPMIKVEASFADNDPFNPRYNRRNATSATRTDTPLMETPVSIQVVPEQVLKDQQAITLADGLKNVSGVQISPSTTYENFSVRGFDAAGSTYRDGIREGTWAVETANVERLEVLKGPGAILYGRIEPGGMINRVLKKPLDIPYYSLQQQFGSFDMYRTTLDATGPLNENKSLTYRFNLAYQDNKSFRDLVNRDRIFLAPQLNWKITDRTEIGIGMEYQRDDFRWDDGFPVYLNGNRPISLPINRSLTDVSSNDHQERQVADLHWSHEFNNNWKLSQQFSTFQSNQNQFHVFPFTWPGVPDNSQFTNRSLWDAQYNRNTYSANTNLLGHFQTGIAKHTLLIGHDYYRLDAENRWTGYDFAEPFNMFTGNNNHLDYSGASYWGVGYNASQQEWNGVYLQDQMVLWDKLHIMGGGRHDWASFGIASSSQSTGDAWNHLNGAQIVNAEKFSPRVGILYRPWDWLSVYGNYTESLGAQNNWNGRNADGTPLKPQEAEQYEAGIKTEAFDGALTTTMAYFEVRKTNLATTDTSSAQAIKNGIMKTVGEARSRGIELDMSGQITENWSIIANYTWLDTKITKDNDGNLGNQLPNAPRHSSNIWTKYDFGEQLKGLSLGTGVRMVTMRQGDPQNSFQLPGYTTWDALAAYKFKIGPT